LKALRVIESWLTRSRVAVRSGEEMDKLRRGVISDYSKMAKRRANAFRYMAVEEK
jgi:hypothetical protein